MAIKHNVLDILPAIRLEPEDICLAHMATKYATENYYTPDYIRKRIWALNPIATCDQNFSNKFPLTKRTLDGISRMRKVNQPLGVVLGKDTLSYLNSSLRPDEKYSDLLLYTFDLICTTVCSRTGEMAPDLSKTQNVKSIITLDQIQFGTTTFKSIPILNRKKFLLSLLPKINSGEISYFRFWLNKTKQHTNVARPFLCTCTVGTTDTPILNSLIKLLLARTLLGFKLNDFEPMFAIPISGKHKPRLLPLSYENIRSADLTRTNHLGYDRHNFKSHLRRKGGASDLFDAGIPTDKIKIIGHWSIGVLDVYLRWDPKEIAKAQIKGIKRAELRMKNGWPSKIYSPS
jgi:hypothetical protein